MKSTFQALLTLFATLALAISACAQNDAPDLVGDYDYVSMQTTHGPIILALDNDRAPISAANFKQYVTDGFYDGTVFHRVLKDFVIQGGGFELQDGSQKQKKTRDPIKNEWRNRLKNIRGALSMARSGIDTATSQFFINTKDNAILDQPRDGASYAVFGMVIDGMDVVDKIRSVEVKPQPYPPHEKSAPVDPIPAITKATMITWDDLSDTARAAVADWDEKATEWHAPALEEKKKLEQREKDIQALFTTVTTALEGPDAKKTDSGVTYIDSKVGDGRVPTEKETVIVTATGWIPDGGVWWRTEDEARKQHAFPIGALSRFKGLQQALLTMPQGTSRYLRIPADMAFGSDGLPTDYWLWTPVPPGSDVIMEVTLVGFQETLKPQDGVIEIESKTKPQ